MNEDYTELRGFDHYGQPSLTNQLESNLKSYLDWSLLRKGAWQNVTTGTVSPFGGRPADLHEVNDRNYSADTVFQSIRKDWIWESGVNYSSPTGGAFNPLTVQVYLDNTAINTGTVGATHHINYTLGRVVFDSPQTATVKAKYSYRKVQVYLADDINWWFEVQYDTFNTADTQWSQNLASGDYSLASTNRIQLPAIVIEPLKTSSAKPYELGGLTKFNKQDVIFHVIAEDRYTRNNLADYLRLQEEKTIILYDTVAVANGGYFPLDERGMVVSNPIIYPDIVNNSSLFYNTARFYKINITDVKTDQPNLHWSVVRAQVEIIH